MKYPMPNLYALWLAASCVRETPPDEVLPGDEELPGDDEPATDEPASDEPQAPAAVDETEEDLACIESRPAHIATALAMYQTGQLKQTVCEWLAGQCPRSVGTPEKAAHILAGHHAGF